MAESLFVGGFGGNHPGVFNAAFADGTTRSVSERIDPAVWRLAEKCADGQIVGHSNNVRMHLRAMGGATFQ
jgi:hypothetical protein